MEINNFLKNGIYKLNLIFQHNYYISFITRNQFFSTFNIVSFELPKSKSSDLSAFFTIAKFVIYTYYLL